MTKLAGGMPNMNDDRRPDGQLDKHKVPKSLRETARLIETGQLDVVEGSQTVEGDEIVSTLRLKPASD